jgi:hypothetical protein
MAKITACIVAGTRARISGIEVVENGTVGMNLWRDNQRGQHREQAACLPSGDVRFVISFHHCFLLMMMRFVKKLSKADRQFACQTEPRTTGCIFSIRNCGIECGFSHFRFKRR